MGRTFLAAICDSHWSERRPASRTDVDWIDTQTAKIENLFYLADNRQAAAILHGGDFFHQPRGPLISRRVDQWLSQQLQQSPCPILGIPGNHDMQGHNLDSLRNHPYGCLEATGLIQSVIWPRYVYVGTDPIVLVTGKEYSPAGSGPWVEELRRDRTLYLVKEEISRTYGVPVFVVALSHGFWRAGGGDHYGEPMVDYGEIADTGIDVLVHGHDHSCNGVNPVETDEGFKYVVGPGAFVRGTLGETDLRREPKIALLDLDSGGNHDITLVSVPHIPAGEIFNLAAYERKKKTREDDLMFIEGCRGVDTKIPTIEVLLSSMDQEAVASPSVIPLTWEYLIRSRDKEIV